MTVLFKFPNRSIWAPPRNPTDIRPPCSQYRNISGTDTVVSAVSHSSPSPIESGSTVGLVSSVPDS